MLNLKIKFRESFRPFAPVVLHHRAADYFATDRESPYMLLPALVMLLLLGVFVVLAGTGAGPFIYTLF